MPPGGAVDFYDTFEHTIDGKGRLVLPSSYRGAFTDGGFLTLVGSYAALFTPEEWEKYRRRLEASGRFSRKELQYLFSFVTPFVPDAQNRISVSPRLRERVGLEREVTIVGSVTHAAIYPRDTWLALEADIEAEASEGAGLSDKFDELGFL